jgi:MFS family permease
MYRLDWIEQAKLRTTELPRAAKVAAVSPAVWGLGWTSFLTDISAEMVSSVLPLYLVLHLHATPLQFGVVDAVYNGFAVALLSLLAGVAADRSLRHKQIAAFGYGIGALGKVVLLAAGGAWAGVMSAAALDRFGKGIRTAPRDALISLHTEREALATAFAAHRAMDAAGMLLGPALAFALLWLTPNAFDVVWFTSLVLGVLGCAVLLLFVPQPAHLQARAPGVFFRGSTRLLFRSQRFSVLAFCGLILSLLTVSDGFLYLLLQKGSSTDSKLFPLFYVLTACSYIAFSMPAARVADRFGRMPVFLSGYALLVLMYSAIQSLGSVGPLVLVSSIAMLGMYYAATEGVLMAAASDLAPREIRTTGVAITATAVALGKAGSSVLFGYASQAYGARLALMWFAVGLLVSLSLAVCLLRFVRDETNVS